MEDDGEEEVEVVVELFDEEDLHVVEQLLLRGLDRTRGDESDALDELDDPRLDLVVVLVEDERPDHPLLREHFFLVDEEDVDLVEAREVVEDRADHFHVVLVRVRLRDLLYLARRETTLS